MQSARWARMMSATVFPLMIESSNCMVLFEFRRPRRIKHGIEIGPPAVRPEEQHGRLPGLRHLRRIALDRRERRPARAAHEQSVSREQFPATCNGLLLRYQDHVVNRGM